LPDSRWSWQKAGTAASQWCFLHTAYKNMVPAAIPVKFRKLASRGCAEGPWT
jgi:hypothetical protein